MKVIFIKDLKGQGKVNDIKELEILSSTIKQINNNLDNIYIDKLNNQITEEQFKRVKLKLEKELSIKQKNIMN